MKINFKNQCPKCASKTLKVVDIVDQISKVQYKCKICGCAFSKDY